MLVLPILAAVTASFGWATGIVLAQSPAQKLGAFEFTRIQLIACSAILATICTAMGFWQTVAWGYWLSFVASICFGIVLGNLAMTECLRRGGPSYSCRSKRRWSQPWRIYGMEKHRLAWIY